MKTKILIFLGLIVVAFSACDLTGESNYRPDIQFVQNPITTKGDTLSIFYTDVSNTYRLDTIHVGDTINFKVYVNAYGNKLKGYYMAQSADSTTRILLPNKNTMDSIFSAASNYSLGTFLMKNDANTLYFPFQYVALKPSLETKLALSVTSDANFEYNQNSFILKTPIVARKVQ